MRRLEELRRVSPVPGTLPLWFCGAFCTVVRMAEEAATSRSVDRHLWMRASFADRWATRVDLDKTERQDEALGGGTLSQEPMCAIAADAHTRSRRRRRYIDQSCLAGRRLHLLAVSPSRRRLELCADTVHVQPHDEDSDSYQLTRLALARRGRRRRLVRTDSAAAYRLSTLRIASPSAVLTVLVRLMVLELGPRRIRVATGPTSPAKGAHRLACDAVWRGRGRRRGRPLTSWEALGAGFTRWPRRLRGARSPSPAPWTRSRDLRRARYVERGVAVFDAAHILSA